MPYTATHPNRGLLNGLIQQHRTNGYDTTFRAKAAVVILNDTTVDDAFIDVLYADAQAANTDADWEGLRDAIVPPPAQTAPADARSLAERLTSLVQSADVRRTINPHVILRSLKRFPQQINLCLSGQDKDLAKTIYEDTERLPQTATEQELKVDGYQINGSLSNGNETLAICFDHNTVPCVLKTLNTIESERIRDLPVALDSPHIIKYKLKRSTRGNYLMIMPLLPATLEHITQLSIVESAKLWNQMSQALSCLHQYGFAHMDVKPSNICLDHAGNFILIDLGSVVQFGRKSASTTAYIPVGLNSHPARATVDWWMLAATLGERGCGMNGWGSGAANPTKKDLLLGLKQLSCSAEILSVLEKHEAAEHQK